MNNPWLKFYVSDWRADPRLKMCSAAARGTWIEMICLMHEASPYGHLLVHGQIPNEAQLASLTGIPAAELSENIAELERMGVCGLTREGVIYSRKLVRMEAKGAKARKSGKKGGNPSLGKQTEKKESLNPLDKGGVKPQSPESRVQSLEKEKETPKGVPKKKVKRGTRLSEEWKLSAAERQFAIDNGLTSQAISIEEQKFRNYWLSLPGAKATKLDWPATWRNWVLNSQNYSRPPPRDSPAAERPGSLMGAIRSTGFGRSDDGEGGNGTDSCGNVEQFPSPQGYRLSSNS